MTVSTADLVKATSLWWPIMLTQERGEISEMKAAEMLGVDLLTYRGYREKAIVAVLNYIRDTPSAFQCLLAAYKEE